MVLWCSGQSLGLANLGQSKNCFFESVFFLSICGCTLLYALTSTLLYAITYTLKNPQYCLERSIHSARQKAGAAGPFDDNNLHKNVSIELIT